METLINCSNCETKLVMVEDNLFYSDEQLEINILCPICNTLLEQRKTDGWFFVQTEIEYENGKLIEMKKQRLIYPNL